MKELLLLALSLAPAVVFLLVILRMDRAEPEPLGAVLKIAGLGAAAAIVAALLEKALEGVPLFHAAGLAGPAAESFLLIATVEEAAKLGVVLLFAWGMASFNEENDGIVYTGAAAIGFAALENVAYVLQGGVGVGIARAFLSVPSHVLSAVIMGLFVGRAKFAAGRRARVLLVAAGFAAAWAEHGLYDTLAMSGSALALLLLPLLGLTLTLGIMSLRRGRRMSLLRWGALPLAKEAAVPSTPARTSRPPRAWMPFVSRPLLGASPLGWILLGIGLGADGTNPSDAILGGVVLTAIPITIGVLVELSWQRRRRSARAAAAAG